MWSGAITEEWYETISDEIGMEFVVGMYTIVGLDRHVRAVSGDFGDRRPQPFTFCCRFGFGALLWRMEMKKW